MGFIAAIKSFFSALGQIATYFQNRQLIDAGKEAERGKQSENALKDIKHVKNIKDDVDDLDDSQLLNELRNPDRNSD